MLANGAWLVVEQPAITRKMQNAANINNFVKRNFLNF